MATNINKYLSSQLQNPGVRGSAVFSDNRVLTATPLPYIETITPGKNLLSGSITYSDAYGNTVPEVNAYIYIYINGFLINPPELQSDGTFNKNDKTAVLSDAFGKWTTDKYFFNVLPAFQYGQTITFRAKAPSKQISNRSVPYMIGGTASPIELGTFGDNGLLRPPYAGESSIMGRVAYWTGHVSPYNGIPLYDCSNHVYVYVDGVHAGTTSAGLGEVFQNEIRGTTASFPIADDLTKYTLSLMVDNFQVDIPFSGLTPIDHAILLGDMNGFNPTFTFFQPDSNLGIKLYKNGLRLLDGVDFNYVIDGGTQIGKVTFTSAVPVPSDKLMVLFQYEAGTFIMEEPLNGVIDGTNGVFNLVQQPRADTIEVYKNGIHLIQDIHYEVSGTTITFIVGQEPEIGSVLFADYQPAIATQQFVFSETPLQLPDGTFNAFFFNTPDVLGIPHIFKNGLLQQEGLFYDYTLLTGNQIVFNPWAIPEDGDNLLVTFYATPVILGQVVDYLNQTAQFKNNCLTASTLNIKPIVNSINIDGLRNGNNTLFTLPDSALPVNFRLFKNGARLLETTSTQIGDYSIDRVKNLIVFVVPPEKMDSLIGLFNYIISDFVVGELPKGPINGANITFALAMIPKANTVQVYYNGIRLSPFGVPDYSVFSNQITFETFTPSAGDIIIVDYEIAYGYQTYTSTFVPQEQITGVNPVFSFPTPEAGTAINVFVNGLLQQPGNAIGIGGIDYTLNRTNILFNQNSLPQKGDTLFIEFNNASLFTDNPNDQLRISSPYRLDIKRFVKNGNQKFDFTETTLFGSNVDRKSVV